MMLYCCQLAGSIKPYCFFCCKSDYYCLWSAWLARLTEKLRCFIYSGSLDRATAKYCVGKAKFTVNSTRPLLFFSLCIFDWFDFATTTTKCSIEIESVVLFGPLHLLFQLQLHQASEQKKIATARKIKINDFRTHSENPFASIKSRKKEFFWKICTVTHHNHNHKVKFFVAFFSVFGSIETICTVNALYRVNCKKILILTFFHISFWFYCWFCICLFGHKV